MLNNAPLVSLIPTCKPDEAKAFYGDVLGLELVHDDPFAVVFRVADRMLRLTKIPQGFTPQPFSVIGWRVDDIDATVAGLVERGVRMLRYDFLEQDDAGIWATPDGQARIAWFHDPDGNVLSVIAD